MELEDFDENDLFIDNFEEEEDEMEKAGNVNEQESVGKKEELTDEKKKKLLESVWEETEKEIKKKAQPRKPRPRLTERELLSENGIPSLKAMFDDYKFPEEMDPYEKLNLMLGKMEFWAHNLFPSMTFSDCLERFERLGRKRIVQNTMRRMRIGMPLDDENVGKDDGEEGHKKDKEDEEIDEESDANIPQEVTSPVNKNGANDDGEESDDLDDFFQRMRKKSADVLDDNVLAQKEPKIGDHSENVDSKADDDDSDIEERKSSIKRKKIIIDDDF